MEQHNGMNCPKCGNEMLSGYMVSGGGKSWLFWYPEDEKPKPRHLLKHGFPLFRKGDVEKGMLLHPYSDRLHYLPALNCPQCKLIMLDYDEEHAEIEDRFYDEP